MKLIRTKKENQGFVYENIQISRSGIEIEIQLAVSSSDRGHIFLIVGSGLIGGRAGLATCSSSGSNMDRDGSVELRQGLGVFGSRGRSGLLNRNLVEGELAPGRSWGGGSNCREGQCRDNGLGANHFGGESFPVADETKIELLMRDETKQEKTSIEDVKSPYYLYLLPGHWKTSQTQNKPFIADSRIKDNDVASRLSSIARLVGVSPNLTLVPIDFDRLQESK